MDVRVRFMTLLRKTAQQEQTNKMGRQIERKLLLDQSWTFLMRRNMGLLMLPNHFFHTLIETNNKDLSLNIMNSVVFFESVQCRSSPLHPHVL